MIELKTYDFKYSVEYDFDSDFSCEESGCYDEGICRCSKITSCSLKSVDVNSILKEINSKYFDNSTSTKRNNKIDTILGDITPEINLYTIDRILIINKIYDFTNWNINIVNGYYGEEIGDILISEDVAEKIKNQLEIAFLKTNLIDRINYLLYLEYGYLLPELNGLKYRVEVINKEFITFGSKSQLEKVKQKNLDYYSDTNYNLIRGVVLKTDSGFRLVDGYHRCYSTNSDKVKVIVTQL